MANKTLVAVFSASGVTKRVAKKKYFDENKEYDGIREKIYSGNAAMLLKKGGKENG